MAGKIVEKDATVKVARQRLSVLEMAETLGNISEACRGGGMDQTSFYEWKRRFQTHGGHVKNFAHIYVSPSAKR